jgi:SP family general alpha glucoside:H+ symporter-like MFS transporter
MSKGKEEKAARALKRLGQSPAEIEKKLANIKVTLEEIRQETEGVTYLECFKKSNLRRTIIAIAPLSIQALSGVYFVSAYATYYFQLAGYSTSASFKLQIVQQSISMIGNIMAWYLVDRVGRRGLMFWGLAALTVMLFLTGGLAVAATPGAIKGECKYSHLYAK